MSAYPKARRAVILLVFILVPAVAATLLLVAQGVMAAETPAAVLPDPSVVKWGLAAAAIATGLSSLAAGYAVAAVGSAAVGALAERPELLGRALVLVGLAEGIAIYGLIISILILNRLG